MEREAAQIGLKGGRGVAGDRILVEAAAGRSRLGRSEVGTLEGITSLSKMPRPACWYGVSDGSSRPNPLQTQINLCANFPLDFDWVLRREMGWTRLCYWRGTFALSRHWRGGEQFHLP
jgi:hypothetical protein